MQYLKQRLGEGSICLALDPYNDQSVGEGKGVGYTRMI